MGQSTGLLVWCLKTTPPSVHDTAKGAVLALEAAVGISPLVRDHICQQNYVVQKSAAQTS